MTSARQSPPAPHSSYAAARHCPRCAIPGRPPASSRLERGCHGQVSQHSRQHIVLVRKTDPTHQVRSVLALGQIARGGAGCASGGQRVNRCAIRLFALKRIGMDRHKQIRLPLARQVAAPFQADVVVPGSNQGGCKADVGFEQRIDFPGDGQHNVFLADVVPGPGLRGLRRRGRRRWR